MSAEKQTACSPTRRTVLFGAIAGGVGAAIPAWATASSASTASSVPATYLVGRAVADMTGECNIGLFGYGDATQTGEGIHLRQRARAFAIVDQTSGNRFMFVQADIQGMWHLVVKTVHAKLQERFGFRYTPQNVMLTANHTHSAPGGATDSDLYNSTTAGVHEKTLNAYADGIVTAITLADADLAPGTVTVAQGQLTDASAQRSRVAFDRNPAGDRAAFPDSAIDPRTVVLTLHRGGRPIGMINWFAVHGTSMPTTNRLVSPDNKGYAGFHWEREVAGGDYLVAGAQPFVAAFAQSAAGDMSPNLDLAPASSNEAGFARTQDIGLRQYAAAQALVDAGGTPVSGPIDSRVSYVDLSKVIVGPEFTPDGQTHHTGDGVYGASFAAGSTEDGGGGLPVFSEGANPAFDLASAAVYTASPDLKECQAPKALLLMTGVLGFTEQVVPLQIVRLGQFYIVAGAQEFTIVSGLRIRRTVAQTLGVPLEQVILSGYANGYAAYCATPEEYDAQEFEGGATLFGKWTLPAYQQEFARIAADLRAGRPSAVGTSPGDPAGVLVSPLANLVDVPQLLHTFGDVLTQPAAAYTRGQQASAAFASADPSNDVRHGRTFLEIQRQTGTGWKRVYDDGDWSTKFRWARDGVASSIVTITWDIPVGAPRGTYRIVHHGDAKGLGGGLTPFTGISRSFTVG